MNKCVSPKHCYPQGLVLCEYCEWLDMTSKTDRHGNYTDGRKLQDFKDNEEIGFTRLDHDFLKGCREEKADVARTEKGSNEGTQNKKDEIIR